MPCTPDGYVIGDVILFHLAEKQFNLVGRAPVLNWVTYTPRQAAVRRRGARYDQRTRGCAPDGRRESLPLPVAGTERHRR